MRSGRQARCVPLAEFPIQNRRRVRAAKGQAIRSRAVTLAILQLVAGKGRRIRRPVDLYHTADHLTLHGLAYGQLWPKLVGVALVDGRLRDAMLLRPLPILATGRP